MGSSPIDSYIATKPGELNRNDVGRCRSRHGSSVRRLNSDLGDRRQTRAARKIVAIINHAFSVRTELDHLCEGVLLGQITHRIVEAKVRSRRRGVTDLGRRSRGGSRVKSVERRRRGRWGGKSLQMQVVDLNELADLNQRCLVWRCVEDKRGP